MPRSWTPCTEVNSTSCELVRVFSPSTLSLVLPMIPAQYIDFEASRPGIVIFCVIVVVVVNCTCPIFFPLISSA